MEIKRKLKERRKNCIEYIQNHYGFQEKRNNRRDGIAFMELRNSFAIRIDETWR